MPDTLAISRAMDFMVPKLAVNMVALEELGRTKLLDKATKAVNMEAIKVSGVTSMETTSNGAAGAATTDIN